jgi:hypothetical protein
MTERQRTADGLQVSALPLERADNFGGHLIYISRSVLRLHSINNDTITHTLITDAGARSDRD